MRSLFAALPLLVAATVPAAAQETRPEQTAASPDGSIVLTVSTDNDQRKIWSLSRKGKLLITPSKLGFPLTDGIALQRGFALESAARASGDPRWEQPGGEPRFVRDRPHATPGIGTGCDRAREGQPG